MTGHNMVSDPAYLTAATSNE